MENRTIKEIQMLIDKATDIAKLCRKGKVRNILQQEQTMMPVIPNDTRREGIFEMLEGILKIKKYINLNNNNNNSYLFIEKDLFDKLHSLLSVFRILKELTKELLAEFLPIFKLNVFWEFSILRLPKLGSDASMLFVKIMNKRGVDIFATDLYRLSNFLDPRLKDNLGDFELTGLKGQFESL